MGNYIQPSSASTSPATGVAAGNPAPNSAITVQPHQPGDAKANPLGLVWPIPRYIEAGLSAKDDPTGLLRR
jgi:hypothetical protein